MPKKPATPQATEAVVLRYAGRGPFRGVPARDLTAADIARLAYQKRFSEIGTEGKRPDPVNPDPGVVKQITAELVGSGLYTQEG